jgi:protein associated with RNAse G/E
MCFNSAITYFDFDLQIQIWDCGKTKSIQHGDWKMADI